MCKFKLDGQTYRFDFYRLGVQEFYWNQDVDNLPEYEIYYRGTKLDTIVSLEKRLLKKVNQSMHSNKTLEISDGGTNRNG